MRRVALLLSLALISSAGCASFDYDTYLKHMPRSILVIPPMNATPEISAPYQVLSSVTRLIAEKGYYVFPVVVVDKFMKANGLPTPGEMNQAPLSKIDEVFGADAVMYIKILNWGKPSMLIDLFGVQKNIAIECRLVDVKTGLELWRRKSGTRMNGSFEKLKTHVLRNILISRVGLLDGPLLPE
jgi:hypothetical protein